MDICYLNTSILKFNAEIEDPGFGSDIVIIDLEDSVHGTHKQRARAVFEALDLAPLLRKGIRFGVRINSLMTIDGLQDLCAISSRGRQYAGGLSFVQLPKVESRFEVELCRSALRDLSEPMEVIPIIETPKGVEHMEEIAAISDAMMFGRVDMTACMYRVNNAYLSYARGRFCVACARHGISAIDTANFSSLADITDTISFEKDCLTGRAEGFTARAVVHPAQVPVVKRVFGIDISEVDAYRATIAAYDAAPTGFSVSGGNVIAPPFVAHAKMMLQLYSSQKAGAA